MHFRSFYLVFNSPYTGYLKGKIFKHGKNYPDIDSLKQVIIETVNNIPQQMIHDSINRFPNLLKQVVENNGLSVNKK